MKCNSGNTALKTILEEAESTKILSSDKYTSGKINLVRVSHSSKNEKECFLIEESYRLLSVSHSNQSHSQSGITGLLLYMQKLSPSYLFISPEN